MKKQYLFLGGTAKRHNAGFWMDREKDEIRDFEFDTPSGNGRKNTNAGLLRDAKRRFADFCRAAFLALTAILAVSPLLIFPDKLPYKDDVDLFLSNYEAIRKSIVEYGEFPFWNPWCHGGVPSFANPQMAVFSIETPCCILFGTPYGLRVAILLYMILLGWGSYLLMGDFVKDKTAQLYGAVVVLLCGSLPIHFINGHYIFLSFVYLPWLLWLLPRVKTTWKYAAAFGFTAGMQINHDLHYVALFNFSILAVLTIAEMIRYRKEAIFWKNLVLAGTVFFGICGYRLWVTLPYLLDYPRLVPGRYRISLLDFFAALTYPFHAVTSQCNAKFVNFQFQYWGWHELGSYVGFIAVIFAVISLFKKIRWFHWAFLLTALLTLDTLTTWLPGYWLREIFPYKSCLSFTRWRFSMILFLSIAAAVGAEWLMEKYAAKKKIVMLFIGISYFMLLANHIWLYSSAVPFKDVKSLSVMKTKRPEGKDFVTMILPDTSTYACVCNNVGNLMAYEVALGYFYQSTFGHFPYERKEYFGEFRAENAKRTYWSPNRIRFYADRPTKVRINSNTGNYWRIDGTQLFPGERAFEEQGFFIFDVKEAGNYELIAVPQNHSFALYFSLISALASLLIIFANIRKKEKS